MKINTKVVFEWSPKSKQYEEVYCDSYEYNGEVAECQWPSWLGGDQNRHRGWGTPQQGRFGTIGEYGTPNATMYYPQQPQRPSTGMSPQYQRGPQMLEDFQPWEFDPMEMGGQETLSYGGQLEPGSGLPGPSVPNEFFSQQLRGFGSEGKIFGPTLQKPNRPDVGTSYVDEPSMLGDVQIADLSLGGQDAKVPGIFDKMKTAWGGVSSEQKAGGLGAIAGGFLGYRQAKSQQKGLGAAIKEIDPLKGKFMGEHKRQLGLAEAYRPGGKYSQYMGGQIMSQAAESAGQESQRMVASGITSPSMMRAMARQSRSQAQNALPAMEPQLSQMALPYEQMGAQSLQQYGGVVEQLASLKGARSAIDPWASALSGGMQGIMAAGQMMSSFMPV